jgi:L-asparaginase / beta-aspartyl-peptidase
MKRLMFGLVMYTLCLRKYFVSSNRRNIMKKMCIMILTLAVVLISGCDTDREPQRLTEFGLAIHGGAGAISRDALTPEQDTAYREALATALQAGYEILMNGGSSMDAVEAAIRIMEDDSLFNAGRGAVFTSEGTNELDASIMDGKTLNAGAVAGVKRIKNPITLARLVMEESRHVMMAREGAEAFGLQYGIETVPEEN